MTEIPDRFKRDPEIWMPLRGTSALQKFYKYRNDPVLFAREVLGIEVPEWQAKLIRENHKFMEEPGNLADPNSEKRAVPWMRRLDRFSTR